MAIRKLALEHCVQDQTMKVSFLGFVQGDVSLHPCYSADHVCSEGTVGKVLAAPRLGNKNGAL